jgi:hypothetical protein
VTILVAHSMSQKRQEAGPQLAVHDVGRHAPRTCDGPGGTAEVSVGAWWPRACVPMPSEHSRHVAVRVVVAAAPTLGTPWYEHGVLGRLSRTRRGIPNKLLRSVRADSFPCSWVVLPALRQRQKRAALPAQVDRRVDGRPQSFASGAMHSTT